MSVYFNGAGIVVSDIVRFEFQDNKPNNSGIETVASVVCQFDVLKALHNTIGQVIADHEAKIAKREEDKKKAN